MMLLSAVALIAAAPANLSHVTAPSAIVMDAATGKILWEKNAYTPRYPASTTKIMTGLLLLENTLPGDVITAPADVTKVRESSMHLKPGERVSAEDMLYAIMLRSANDGCYAVASHISGSVGEFSKLMNQRARQIGCRSTHFTNPHGLPDKAHVTTAYDLALMGRKAMKYEAFEQVARSQRRQIERSINQQNRVMNTRNKWLAKDATADGIKTGWTRASGACYVGSATRNGFRVITVVLKSDNWQQDHQDMLNWAFANWEKVPVAQPGEPVGTVAVPNGDRLEVPVAPEKEVFILTRRGRDAGLRTRVEPKPDLAAPIDRGDVVAELVAVDGQGHEHRVPLLAQEDVATEALFAKLTRPGQGMFMLGGSVVLAGAWARRRGRRQNFYARRRRI
jgi:serine-type D-Ala-D-Ala carboxypeptidase (penicillin-binding protein 5/6)